MFSKRNVKMFLKNVFITHLFSLSHVTSHLEKYVCKKVKILQKPQEALHQRAPFSKAALLCTDWLNVSSSISDVTVC